MERNGKSAEDFVKNSLRILSLRRNKENNTRNVLELYRTLSLMTGPEESMAKLFDGVEKVKAITEKDSVDPLYNFRVIRNIEDNFEKYFQETRYPSEHDVKIFNQSLSDGITAMHAESELLEHLERKTKKYGGVSETLRV